MKVLFIPDTHLKFKVMEPFIEDVVSKYSINQVVFMGDYTDAHNQTNNAFIYISDLLYLTQFKEKLESQNIDCKFLLGNHDCHYLCEIPADYTFTRDALTFINIQGLLYDLNIQPLYMLDNEILVSHAGFNKFYEPNPSLFEVLKSSSPHPDLALWTISAGVSRGGVLPTGNFLWNDKSDFEKYPNTNYPKQVVGHTPVETVCTLNDVWFTDTFSITPSNNKYGYDFLGDGSLLIYDGKSKKFEIISTLWKSNDTLKSIRDYFNSERKN
ncbi:metallophosphoesterase [Aerococcaceae bacterium NML190938]|nr:metallophosphoesterase [Aerococcaceae bacterium NML190938]